MTIKKHLIAKHDLGPDDPGLVGTADDLEAMHLDIHADEEMDLVATHYRNDLREA